MKSSQHWFQLFSSVAIVLQMWLLQVPVTAESGAYVWLEGESGSSAFDVQRGGWGHPEFLSEERWIHVSVEADQVEGGLPEGGIVIDYDFEIEKAGAYEVWDRIGFEFARSTFEWRVDDGEWAAVTADELTTDCVPLDFWCEVAWLKLGAAELSAGPHRLQIRLPKLRKADGGWERVLYASDALCLYAGSFRPDFKYRPGGRERTESDRAAAEHRFELPTAPGGQRAMVRLDGLWEVARADEQLPGRVDEPIAELPEAPVWSAIPVPSDRNVVREDLIFAHRLWYRTRVAVPATMAGRSFFIDFPSNNLNTTVYVNGVLCGFERNPFVPFQVDVTKGMRAGAVNEIWVGIRDAWYGRSADPERPMKLRRTFNMPMRFFSEGFQDLDYPVWNCPQSGILCTPTLWAAGGAVYTEDVFAKPSVSQQRMDAEVSLRNPSGGRVSGELHWAAVDEATGRLAKRFEPVRFEVDPGSARVIQLSEDWADPELWWPNSPHLYRLRTTLMVDGRAMDVAETTFGFREWQSMGTKFVLNGVVWHMWADLVGTHSSPESWLEAYRATNQRMMRLMIVGQGGHTTRWQGLEPREALDFFDRNGVVVRRNTTLDGERIGYNFSESDEETRRKQGGSELKLALMENWRSQCVAQAKGERNHPSIQIWTIENEFAYINLINLLGNSPNMDAYEEEITRTHDAVRAVDPTRPVMIDGGGATKTNTLSVHGDHYVATLDSRYPDLAYEAFTEGGGRGRWKWDMQRPRFLGEDWFATGINPADYAMWGGEVAFQGKAATRDAIALIYRMLNEGYRWGGHYAAWQFWTGAEGGEAQWGANHPRAVFCRQWDWTFPSDREVVRTFGIFNDTRFAEPITFQRQLLIDGREVYSKESTQQVAPGTAFKFDDRIPMPAVTDRTAGELRLTLVVDGESVFEDVKPLAILPPPVLEGIDAGALAVWDPKGAAAEFLTALGVSFVRVESIEGIPGSAKLLLVGADALSEEASTSTQLAAFASKGHSVVVLDQDHPLKYQALPAEMELAPRTDENDFGTEIPTSAGKTAFIEDASHPALQGLKNADFFTWGPDHQVFRNAYRKPTRGAKSLVQCGPRLGFSALVEVPVGEGLMLLSQLDIGAKLGVNPVADQLLVQLILTGLEYERVLAPVAVVSEDAELLTALDAIGLKYFTADDPLEAISAEAAAIVIVSAQPANLAGLAEGAEELSRFWARGGNLLLCGLTPEGLAAYNRIVGVEHHIRPFGRERVTFPAVRDPLTAGLTTGDVVMLSGERIFGWTADEYVAADVFTYIVDLDDIAPFARSDFGNFGNIVNGFVGSDGWPLIIDFEFPRDGGPFEIRMELPSEQVVTEYVHDMSLNYNPTTRIGLLFDGGDGVEFELDAAGDAESFAIAPPRRAKRVTLQLLDYRADPGRRPLVGIDNIELKVQRSDAWRERVRPMLNLGGLVRYRFGAGNAILCNLNFQEREAVPINKTKKRTILAAILRNLNAEFQGERTVIPGGDLEYTPLDIHTKATTYKDERGWFGDGRFSFKSLPAGVHEFQDVEYWIYEMPTSPVPQVLMLGGRDVPGDLPEAIEGIPVGMEADALFFLHTARIDRPMSEREREAGAKIELCKYVVRYADGERVEVPVYLGLDVDSWLQASAPRALPGAQLAWTLAYPDEEHHAALYAMQWNNPRPEGEIESVDLVYGADGERGVPVLVGLTAVGRMEGGGEE